jgi:drug/metabolite transporter (DMT)-like permease
VLLALVCALFVGGFMIFAKPYFARYGALRMTTLAIVISAVGLWVGVGLLFGRWVDFTTIGAMPSGQVAALLTIGFFNTTITQWFWLGGLAAAPDITRAAYLFFLKPVIAALLALWILQHPVSSMEWLAIAVICGAVAFEALWPRLADRLGFNTAREA